MPTDPPRAPTGHMPVDRVVAERGASRWAASGAMALTGDEDGPPLAPPTRAAIAVDEALAPFGLDATVLGERAARLGLRRGGRTSCGGATRLLRALDGWVAVALARDDDVASLPAAFGIDAPDAARAWPPLAEVVGSLPGAETAARAQALGIAASVVGGGAGAWSIHRREDGGTTAARPPARSPVVVDLTSLWAGPLCARLLGRVGARVTTVEDARRPDATRSTHPAFYALLHDGNDHLVLDLGDERSRSVLRSTVEAADVVITSARRRAFDQLDLSVDRFLGGGADRIWVAITGHGWDDPRIGFGDDAAAAAGLVAWHPVDGEPRFAGDALADPLCGSFAAAAAHRAWEQGGRWFLDVSLSGAAAQVAPTGRPPARAATPRGTGWVLDGTEVAPPR